MISQQRRNALVTRLNVLKGLINVLKENTRSDWDRSLADNMIKCGTSDIESLQESDNLDAVYNQILERIEGDIECITSIITSCKGNDTIN